MTVKFDYEQDLQTVLDALTDPEFLVDRCLALGELSAECEAEEDEQGITLNLVREIQRDMPRALAKVFGSTQVTDMTEQWWPDGDGWSGHWTMNVRGQPVTIKADFALQPQGNGCRYSVSHSAKAMIPLLGRQVEKFILSQTAGGARDELTYLQDYLG